MSLIAFLINFAIFLFGNKFFNIQNSFCDFSANNIEAWTIYGSINNFNIAFPDIAAHYRGTFVCMKDDETITLESDIPYARYYSVQIYDSSTASLGSLNDNQISISNGKFKINITKSMNSTNSTNSTKNVLKITTNDRLLMLIFRVYDVPTKEILESKLNVWSHNRIESFGWIDVPKIFKYNENHNKIQIKNSKNYTLIGFPQYYLNYEPFKKSQYDNIKNNFFKPHSNGYFSNSEANYLVSTINFKKNETDKKIIGAIIKGYLPIVYHNKFNFNHSKQLGQTNQHNPYNKSNQSNQFNQFNQSCVNEPYYEVKYISFNMGTLSLPFPTIAGNTLKMLNNEHFNKSKISSTGYAGIRDIDIIMRYNDSNDWNSKGRPYVIYVGTNEEHIKKLGGNPKIDLFMTFPVHYETGMLFDYPVIIFRHLMSQDKFMKNPKFLNGISMINKSFATPSECKKVMKKYYPTIDFIQT